MKRKQRIIPVIEPLKNSTVDFVHTVASVYFNAKDNWNILPSVSYLNVSKYIGSNFSFGVTGSVNKISKFVNPLVAPSKDYKVTNPLGDANYYAADAVINYSLQNLLKSKTFEPSAKVNPSWLPAINIDHSHA